MKIINGATAVSFNETSCDVIVVPIFAPNVIPTDCSKVMIPALTKPTSITVVAPDDWINAVNKAPHTTAIYLFLVQRSKMVLNLPPAACCKLSLIYFIPKRNSANPLSNCVINTYIFFLP